MHGVIEICWLTLILLPFPAPAAQPDLEVPHRRTSDAHRMEFIAYPADSTRGLIFTIGQAGLEGTNAHFVKAPGGTLSFLWVDDGLPDDPFHVGRVYDSERVQPGSVPEHVVDDDFGSGWRLTPGDFIEWDGRGRLAYHADNGVVHEFTDLHRASMSFLGITLEPDGTLQSFQNDGTIKMFSPTSQPGLFLLTYVALASGEWLRLDRLQGRITRIESSSGATLEFYRQGLLQGRRVSGWGRVEYVKDQDDRFVIFRYDNEGRLAETVTPQGERFGLRYSTEGRLQRVEDPDGDALLEVEYEIGGRVRDQRVHGHTLSWPEADSDQQEPKSAEDAKDIRYERRSTSGSRGSPGGPKRLRDVGVFDELPPMYDDDYGCNWYEPGWGYCDASTPGWQCVDYCGGGSGGGGGGGGDGGDCDFAVSGSPAQGLTCYGFVFHIETIAGCPSWASWTASPSAAPQFGSGSYFTTAWLAAGTQGVSATIGSRTRGMLVSVLPRPWCDLTPAGPQNVLIGEPTDYTYTQSNCYGIQWNGGTDTCPSTGTSSPWTTAFIRSGASDVTLNGSDGCSVFTTAVRPVTVAPCAVSASGPSSGHPNELLNYSAVPVGATNGTFSWSAPGGSPSSGSSPVFSTLFPTTGSQTVTAGFNKTVPGCISPACLSDTLLVAITDPPPQVTINSSNPQSLVLGQSLSTTATGRDGYGNPAPGTYTWATSNASILQLTPSGSQVQVKGIGTGSANLSVSFTTSAGTASDSIQVNVQDLVADLVIHKPLVVDPGESALPEATELSVGAQTFVNLDNDDRDGQFDTGSMDTNVVGEDELVKLELKIMPQTDGGSVTLSATSGSADIRVWQSATKGAEYVLGSPVAVPGSFVPQAGALVRELWVEGITPHSLQRATKLTMTYTRDGVTRSDEAALTIIGIDRISWAGRSNSVNDDDALDPEPNWPQGVLPGSVRVFPDARAPGGTVEPGPRDMVDVTVTLSVDPVDPVNIHFDSFDVDDPTSDTLPIDDSASGANEGSAEDNRGTSPARSGMFVGEVNGFKTQSFSTRQASLQFHVTMHPGDNFRVAGSGDIDFLADLQNDDPTLGTANDDKQRITNRFVTGTPADREIREPGSYASDTALTVWRFLHVESDSMVAVPAPPSPDHNRIMNQLTGIRNMTTELTLGSVLADGSPDLDDSSPGNGRFEEGTIRVGAGPSAVTISLTGNGNDFVRSPAPFVLPFTLTGPGPMPPPDAGGTITTFTGNTFLVSVTSGALSPGHAGGTMSLAGVDMTVSSLDPALGRITVQSHSIPVELRDDDDENILPALAAFSGMAAPFGEAYILPLADGGTSPTNNQQNITFLANVVDPNNLDMMARQDTPVTSEQNRFWVAYLASAYQYLVPEDYDPKGDPGGTGGSTLGSFHNAMVARGGDVSWIYLETNRDREASTPPADPGLVARVAAHEMGHQLGLHHLTGTGTLMDTSLQTIPGDPGFAPIHLHLLRSRVKSPGQ